MKSDEQLQEIRRDIYREAYRKSEPKADFDAMVASGEAGQERFYMKYYLPDEILLEIIATHCKRNKLDKIESTRVKGTVLLGCAPTGVRTPG